MEGLLPRSPRSPRRLWWIAGGVLGAVAAAGAIVLAVLPANGPAPGGAPAPARADAYAHGGRPLSGTPDLRELLGHTLPAWVVALDRHTAYPDRREITAALAARRADVEREAVALDPEGRHALGELLDEARRVGDSTADLEGDTDSLLSKVASLNAHFSGRGLGYYVDASLAKQRDDGRRRVYLSTFTVERVRIYEAEGRRELALDLKRLDDLSFQRSLMGFTRPRVQEALVLLDQVEEHLVMYALPTLAPDSPVPIADEDTRRAAPAWLATVAERAGRVIREELSTASGVNPDDAGELGVLLTRRRRLFEQWAGTFERRGLVLTQPRTYELDPAPFEALRSQVPNVDELQVLHDSLGEPRMLSVYHAVTDLWIASVERHEVQHRLDFAGGTLTRMPAELEALVGPLKVGDLDNARAARSLAELSAYLSELVRDDRTLRTNLTLLSVSLFDRTRWGTPECHAALVIFEGLAEELELPDRGPLVGDRRVLRESVAPVYLALTEAEPAAVRRGAGALWARLFGRPLPTLRRVTER